MLINILLATAWAKWYARPAVNIELQIFHGGFIVLRDNGNTTTSAAAVLTSMSAKSGVIFFLFE